VRRSQQRLSAVVERVSRVFSRLRDSERAPRGRLRRAVTKNRRGDPGSVDRMDVPDLRIGHAEREGHEFEEAVGDVEDQSLNSSLNEGARKMFGCSLEVGTAEILHHPKGRFKTVELRDRTVIAGGRTFWELLLAIRHEVEASGAGCGADIRNSDKYNFVSSGLHFASQCGHRVDMTSKR
jgi:hypothetical protein